MQFDCEKEASQIKREEVWILVQIDKDKDRKNRVDDFETDTSKNQESWKDIRQITMRD